MTSEMERYNHVVGLTRQHVLQYGYQEIATPIVEHCELFDRTLGQASDVVSKEVLLAPSLYICLSIPP